MSAIDNSSNNPAYIAAINLSEATRQSEEEQLYQNFGQPGTATAQTVTGNESVALALAIKQASIRDFQRRVMISNTYGENPAPWIEGLKTLGINSLY